MSNEIATAGERYLAMTHEIKTKMENIITSLRITGLLALLGALLYAIGDVLLLASKASLDHYPKLKPFAKLLSDAEKMVVLPPNRMIWGALTRRLCHAFGSGRLLASLPGIEWRERNAHLDHRAFVCHCICDRRLRPRDVLLHGRIYPGIEQS